MKKSYLPLIMLILAPLSSGCILSDGDEGEELNLFSVDKEIRIGDNPGDYLYLHQIGIECNKMFCSVTIHYYGDDLTKAFLRSVSVLYDGSWYWSYENTLSASIPIDFAEIYGEVTGIVEITLPEELVRNISFDKIEEMYFDIGLYNDLGVGIGGLEGITIN